MKGQKQKIALVFGKLPTIEESDQFQMKPGYYNFKAVNKGEILAHDRKGNITSPCNGMIFMPLYQKSGNDGFFIVDNV